jgi:hypothetical protein
MSHSSHSHGVRANLAILTTTLDSFVAILVQIGEVLPQFLVSSMDDVSILDGGELGSQSADGGNMEFVLV